MNENPALDTPDADCCEPRLEAPRILLVDDEFEMLDILQDSLSGLGHHVITASSGPEALEILRSDPAIGVVVSDYRMPGMDGLELAGRVAGSLAPDRDVQMLILTGCGTKELAMSAFRFGVTDFLEKPVDLDELNESLCRAIERWQVRKSELGVRRELVERVARQAGEIAGMSRELSERSRQLINVRNGREVFMNLLTRELRTPLHQIIMSMDIMEDAITAGDRDFSRRIGEVIRAAAGRLEESAQRAVLLADFRSGKVSLSPRWIDIDLMTQAIRDRIDRHAALSSRLEVVDETRDAGFYADPELISRALTLLATRVLGDRDGEAAMRIRFSLGDREQFIVVEGEGATISIAELTADLSELPIGGQVGVSLDGPELAAALAGFIFRLHGGGVVIEERKPGSFQLRVRLPAR